MDAPTEQSQDSLTIQVLKQIRDEIRSTNSRLDDTNRRLEQGLGELKQEIVELRAETRRGFMLINARFENLRDRAGERDRELEKRVASLEDRVAVVEAAQRGDGEG